MSVGLSLGAVVFLIFIHVIMWGAESSIQAVTAGQDCAPQDAGCLAVSSPGVTRSPFQGDDGNFQAQQVSFLSIFQNSIQKLFFFQYDYWKYSQHETLRAGWGIAGLVIGTIQLVVIATVVGGFIRGALGGR